MAADHGVEAGGGLVVEEGDGVGGDGAGDGDALGHAAGELAAVFVEHIVHVQRGGGQACADAAHGLFGRERGVLFEPEGDVVVHGAAEEGVVLEDDGPEQADFVELVGVEG